MKRVAMILLLAVMGSCSTTHTNKTTAAQTATSASRSIASDKIYVVKKFSEMYNIGRLYSTHKIALLTSAMIFKKKTPQEVNVVYKRVKRLFPSNSDQAQLSIITKFLILNNFNIEDEESLKLFKLNYKKIAKELPLLAFDSAVQLALLTSAMYIPKDHRNHSNIPHYSAEEIVRSYKSIKREFGGVGTIEQFAELTKLSIEKNLNASQIYELFKSVDSEKFYWNSGHQVAILTSAMVHTGFTAAEVVNAHSMISSRLIEMASEYTAELTRTALILEAQNVTENLVFKK